MKTKKDISYETVSKYVSVHGTLKLEIWSSCFYTVYERTQFCKIII